MMRYYYRAKRETHRWLVDRIDLVEIWWCEKTGRISPGQAYVMALQDRRSLDSLEQTIGVALGTHKKDKINTK